MVHDHCDGGVVQGKYGSRASFTMLHPAAQLEWLQSPPGSLQLSHARHLAVLSRATSDGSWPRQPCNELSILGLSEDLLDEQGTDELAGRRGSAWCAAPGFPSEEGSFDVMADTSSGDLLQRDSWEGEPPPPLQDSHSRPLRGSRDLSILAVGFFEPAQHVSAVCHLPFTNFLVAAGRCAGTAADQFVQLWSVPRLGDCCRLTDALLERQQMVLWGPVQREAPVERSSDRPSGARHWLLQQPLATRDDLQQTFMVVNDAGEASQWALRKHGIDNICNHSVQFGG
eukprot:scaffold1243_cov403-Prasinococcus_capsulatus_cf.AAC.18